MTNQRNSTQDAITAQSATAHKHRLQVIAAKNRTLFTNSGRNKANSVIAGEGQVASIDNGQIDQIGSGDVRQRHTSYGNINGMFKTSIGSNMHTSSSPA